MQNLDAAKQEALMKSEAERIVVEGRKRKSATAETNFILTKEFGSKQVTGTFCWSLILEQGPSADTWASTQQQTMLY
jgi:hypothetical protein